MGPQPGYRFASKAHWDACLLVGADRAGQNGKDVVRPFAAFEAPATPIASTTGAYAPAYTPVREVVWRDDAGMLHRLPDGDDDPQAVAAPAAIATASRIVSTAKGLWVAGRAAATVECFDPETLSRRLVVELPGARVIDIAADGREAIRVLVARGDAWHVDRIDCAGTVGASAPLEGIAEPGAFTYVRADDRLVVLSRDGARIFVFAGTGGAPAVRLLSSSLAPCFVGSHIAGHPRGRVFLAGTDRLGASNAHVVVLEASGVKLDDVPLSETATGLAAGRDSLLVTGKRGLYIFRAVDPVPDSVAGTRTMLVTPMLEAPETEGGRRWLRIEVAADLPAGSSLEVAYAATDDPEVRDEMLKISRDVSVPVAKRAQVLHAAADLWSTPITFHGGEAGPNEANAALAVPLHDVRGRYLWVAVSLVAGPGGGRPVLSRLSVLYVGHTLMEHLPAIYQRAEAEPGSFIRALVGVLETTTQDLDELIAQLGRSIQPDHASAPWLDYLARWLGLPWDDALDVDQKSCIVRVAARLARARGTRAGLEALLECVVARQPGRFRVVDGTGDHGVAHLGGGECLGAMLPAMLGGLPPTTARLGVQATLGSMRLPCPGECQEDGTSRFLGRIRVDLAANAQERRKWEPWITRLVTEMVPVGTRASVRWTTASALRGDRLDDSLSLEADNPPRLGTDAITGLARLPRGASTLPASDTGGGPTLE